MIRMGLSSTDMGKTVRGAYLGRKSGCEDEQMKAEMPIRYQNVGLSRLLDIGAYNLGEILIFELAFL